MDQSFTRLLAAVAFACAGTALAQVTPPPLPPGSHLVRAEPGMAEPERKRHVRAHHHKFHHQKDFTRDDSIHGHESQAVVRTGGPGAGAAAVPGAAPGAGANPGAEPAAPRTVPPVGGPGTGPVREKTDRGASSFFHGKDTQ